jgi:hypothetical protein
MFALRDNGGDEVIDDPNNAAPKKPCGPPNRIRGRISNIAQNAHGEPSLEELVPFSTCTIASGTPPRREIRMSFPLD